MARTAHAIPRPATPTRRRAAGLPLALILAWVALTAGCRSANPALFPPSVATPHQPAKSIYISINHWHAGLILADADITPALRDALTPWTQQLEKTNPNPTDTWHEFGWGDDRFYKSPKATSGQTLAAMLWPTRSVVHLWSLPQNPPDFFAPYNAALFRIELSQPGYQRLADNLLQHLALNNQHANLEQTGIYGNRSAFLTAHPKRKYHLLHNCNHMTADALRAAGLPITPLYAIHSRNIEYQLDQAAKKFAAIQRLQSRNPPATQPAAH